MRFFFSPANWFIHLASYVDSVQNKETRQESENERELKNLLDEPERKQTIDIQASKAKIWKFNAVSVL